MLNGKYIREVLKRKKYVGKKMENMANGIKQLNQVRVENYIK